MYQYNVLCSNVTFDHARWRVGTCSRYIAALSGPLEKAGSQKQFSSFRTSFVHQGRGDLVRYPRGLKADPTLVPFRLFGLLSAMATAGTT